MTFKTQKELKEHAMEHKNKTTFLSLSFFIITS